MAVVKEGTANAHVTINMAKTNNDLLLSDLFPTNEGHTSIKHVLSSTSPTLLSGSSSSSYSKRKSSAKRTGLIEKNEVSNKPRRKRRVFSCDNCRKLKTKCVNDTYSSTCERCKRLHIECNLPVKVIHEHVESANDTVDSPRIISKREDTGEEDDEEDDKSGPPLDTGRSASNSVNFRLVNVETSVSLIEQKLNTLIELQQNTISIQHQQSQLQLQQQIQKQFIPYSHSQLSPRIRRASQDGSFVSNTEASTPSVANFIDLSAHLPLREDLTAPLNLIEKIQTTLIGKPQNHSNTECKSDFEKATAEFIEFYLQNEILCLQLSKEYLEVSHYYIIPGGISVIDRDYVLEHPFITCVFVLIAMTVSKKYKNTDSRVKLEKILKNIISSINCKEPLTDHDIESILYICMYDIGGFDNWLLSTSGLMHYFVSIDSRSIIDRVVNDNIYSDDDLFHLRILNALCACHLQTAIGLGRSIMIDDTWWKVHRLTVLYPNATIGDAIQVAQLDLFKMLLKILKDPEYFNESTFFESLEFAEGQNTFQCEDLKKWKKKWEKILSKDISKISSYSYNFAYILVARKFVDLNSTTTANKDKLNIAYNTALNYSFKLLTNFLDSKADIIKGIPSFQLWEVVYACVSLFEYLGNLPVLQRKKALNMISKTYWHLNKMGQELNDATGTIAEIVKKLVEMANKNQVLHITTKQDKGFIGSGSITRTNMYTKRKNSQQQKKLSPEDLPIFMGNDLSTQPSPLLAFAESPSKRNISGLSGPSGINGNSNGSGSGSGKVSSRSGSSLGGISGIRGSHSNSGSRNNELDQYQYPLKMSNRPSVTFSELRTTSAGVGVSDRPVATDDGGVSGESPVVLSSQVLPPVLTPVPVFQMPDVSTFSSFDEFFKDLFNDYPQQ